MLSPAREQSHGMQFGRRIQKGFVNTTVWTSLASQSRLVDLEEGEADFFVFKCKGLAQACHQNILRLK